MIARRLQAAGQWLRRVVTQPGGELTRWQRAARFAYDLGRFGAHQLREDRAPQMAAALAYRTLFGLLPVLVVTAVFVRALRGAEAFNRMIGDIIEGVGLDLVPVGNIPTADGASATLSLGEWLRQLIDRSADINLTAVGWVGVAVLVYSALGLMVTIENSFNTICRAPEGRSWLRRVPMYWFVLTVGPVAVALTQSIDSGATQLVPNLAWLVVMAQFAWSFTVVWLTMLAFYMLIPNMRLSLRAVLAGAFVATVLLEIGKNMLGVYMTNAVSLRQVAGSLGLIPVFMFWVYVMWLIVLFGLEVASTLHHLRGRRLAEVERNRRIEGLVDPAAVILVMEHVAARFVEARPATTRQLVDATGLPEVTLERLLKELVRTQFLHRLEDDEAVTLARPAERIEAADLMQVGYRLLDESESPRSWIVRRLREAQLTQAAGITLAAPVQEPPAV